MDIYELKKAIRLDRLVYGEDISSILYKLKTTEDLIESTTALSPEVRLFLKNDKFEPSRNGRFFVKNILPDNKNVSQIVIDISDKQIYMEIHLNDGSTKKFNYPMIQTNGRVHDNEFGKAYQKMIDKMQEYY